LKSEHLKVAVVGVTGLVGGVMCKVLEDRRFPVDEFIPVASERSVGKEVKFQNHAYTVLGMEEALDAAPDSPPPAPRLSTIPRLGAWSPIRSWWYPK
jgi:hypothetical protein